jgi:peptide/nickel transport system substrate-binding protein
VAVAIGGRGFLKRSGRAVAGTCAVLVLLLAVVPAALGQESGSNKKVTLTVGLTANLKSINPFKAVTSAEYEVFFLVYDMLFNFDQKDLSASPALATDYEKSSDGKTWRFTIRDDVTWHDGRPLTAADIAFTYGRIVNDPQPQFTSYLPFVKSVSAPDDTTLVMRFTKPNISPLIPPWVPILPEHVWGKLDAKEMQSFKNFPPVGSGPFKLVEWKEGQFWRLEANKDYWGEVPKIDEIVFRVFNNDEAMVQALKTGEIDFAEALIPSLFDSLEREDNPNITTHATNSNYYVHLSMNQIAEGSGRKGTGHPALLDHDVRLAIAHAIDKDTLVEKAWLGNAEPGSSIVLPTYKQWHWEPPADEVIQFDLDESNRILEQAGYVDTDGDGVREMPGGGRPLEFRYFVRSEDPPAVTASQFIKGWLKNIGIEAKVQSVSTAKLGDIWYANDYDLYSWGWGPDPDPDFILSTFTTGQCKSWSDTCWSNPEYDSLYREQRTALDLERRRELVDRMQQMVYEAVPEVVLYYEKDLQAYRNDRFTGFVEQPEPQGSLLFQFGSYSYTNIRPTGETAESAGISTGVWIAGVAGVVLVAVAGALMRRRTGDENRA